MRDTATTDTDRFLALLQPIERDLETYARRLMWEPQEAALAARALQADADADHAIEAAEAGLSTVVCVTEGVPVHDMMQLVGYGMTRAAAGTPGQGTTRPA